MAGRGQARHLVRTAQEGQPDALVVGQPTHDSIRRIWSGSGAGRKNSPDSLSLLAVERLRVKPPQIDEYGLAGGTKGLIGLAAAGKTRICELLDPRLPFSPLGGRVGSSGRDQGIFHSAELLVESPGWANSCEHRQKLLAG